MNLPIIAAQTGAALIILQMVLMLATGLYRTKTQTALGISDDAHLERVVRRHGNLAENAAIFIVVLALAEIIALSSSVLGIMAMIFVIARVLHALGFSSLAGSHMGEGNKFFLVFRVLGAFGTALTGLALGGYLGYSLFLG